MVDSAARTGSDMAAASTGKVLTKIELVGKTVFGADEEAVGKIDDVVMSKSGTIESVLIDIGGFLGIGARQVAIPVEKLEIQGDAVVATGLTKRQAEEMPEYKRQQ